ncbi:accessory Sec system protein Asp1 [Fructilactobacillus ixorae]|uniref:Accessory Sec system protein Asp1 n=1 Tax=Fructilactobacillus ixorae TaxID=1750535 RepID=A0ABY5C5J1_9LACO|nr:accessory Sec system protein Asp1 [Fructilactobacillus ixorae]USS93662.1 accessory Sec system protein Asp1 [Fructilactobacillus ixorae]
MTLIIPNFQDAHGRPLADLPEVGLAKLLQQAEEPVELAFVQSSLTLKRELQQLGLQDIPYWDVFADLQHVESIEGLPLNVFDFPTPAGYEPFFNPSNNQVCLYKDNTLAVEITVHNQLEVERVVYFEPDGVRRINYYSDAGFLSTTVWLNTTNQIIRQEWYTPLQQVVFWRDEAQQFQIDPAFQSEFSLSTYPSLQSIIKERYERHFHTPEHVVAAYRSGVMMEDQFHLSLPAQHMVALLEPEVNLDKVAQLKRQFPATQWVFPSQKLAQRFQTEYDDDSEQVVAIEPYPTSFNPGLSNEFEAQFVYLQLRNQTEAQIAQLVEGVLPELQQDENMVLLVAGDDASRQLMQLYQRRWIWQHLGVDVNGDEFTTYTEAAQPRNFQTESEWLDYIDNEVIRDDVELTEADLHRFYRASLFQSQIQLIKEQDQSSAELFQKVRLFVYMGMHADLKKQIQAISAGVPIISTTPTDLVRTGENGFYNQDLATLPDQLNYFLQDLHHWNQAVVASVDLMEEYEQDQLLERWKGVLKHGKA